MAGLVALFSKSHLAVPIAPRARIDLYDMARCHNNIAGKRRPPPNPGFIISDEKTSVYSTVLLFCLVFLQGGIDLHL
jgi:hypothetical protein